MSEHLDDGGIDLYVARRLPAAIEEAVEIHLVGCAACAERVAEVQDLARALEPASTPRGVLAWQLAAAVSTAACLLLALEVVGLRGGIRRGASEPERPLGDAPRAAPAVMEHALAAATRNDGPIRLRRAGAQILVLVVDARELAPPREPLDVVLRGADGLERARFGALRSSASGSVRVPLPAGLLADGPHVLEIRWRDEVLAIPFTVEP